MLNNIKKIAAAVTVMAAAFSLFSCSDELSQFRSALSAPVSTAEVVTALESEHGTLTGEYTATYADGVVKVEYVRQTLGEISENTDEDGIILTDKGTITIDNNGTTSATLGGLVLAALTRSINLSGDYVSPVIDGGVLNFTVEKEDTAAVLGVALEYAVTVSVITVGGALSGITMEYTARSGKATLSATFG